MQQYYQVPDLKNSDIRRLARRSLRGRWTAAMIPMIIITVAIILPAVIQYMDLFASGILDAVSMQDLQEVMKKLEQRQSGVLYSILSFFSFLCSGAFSLAAAALSVRILRKEPFSIQIAFIGFRQFIQAFLVDFLTTVFSLLWSLVTILPGTVVLLVCSRSALLSLIGSIVFAAAVIAWIFLILRYNLSFFIAQDNGTLPALHAIRYSVTLMKGRIWKFFSLQLSFIGWIVLASIPMSVGIMFLNASSRLNSGMMKVIAVGLILIGLVTTAMVQLYVNTADAVFYSAVSGNFGIAGSSSDDENGETLPSGDMQETLLTDGPEHIEPTGSGVPEQELPVSSGSLEQDPENTDTSGTASADQEAPSADEEV